MSINLNVNQAAFSTISALAIGTGLAVVAAATTTSVAATVALAILATLGFVLSLASITAWFTSSGNTAEDFFKEIRKWISNRSQNDSLESISKMTIESISKMTIENMDALCKNLKVNNRNDYVKCMLFFAIKAEKFHAGNVDMVFHQAIPYFRDTEGKLRGFVHEDIAAGRENHEDTLLHEILKCKFLSPKAKAEAFGFILRDGHDYLRDYLGTRISGEVNQYGGRSINFEVFPWGDSLKKIFDAFPSKEQGEFFECFKGYPEVVERLESFTRIVQHKPT